MFLVSQLFHGGAPLIHYSAIPPVGFLVGVVLMVGFGVGGGAGVGLVGKVWFYGMDLVHFPLVWFWPGYFGIYPLLLVWFCFP